MESQEYWKKRALKLEARANDKGEALQKQLKREYTKAAKEIRQKVDSFYLRYASEQGLSYAEAVKALSSKEAREWKKTIGEYVDEIKALPDGKLKNQLLAELDMRSYASQQDRLSTLAAQIDMEVDRLFVKANQQMTDTMTDILADGYLHKSFDLQQRAGVLTQTPRLSPQAVENALTYPWSGSDFSSRLWENKRALLFNLRQTLTQGTIQGQSIARMSKGLADTLGKSYITAERLIRTESNHFHAEADKSAYKAAGVKQYEFMATLDNRTSDICAGLDGKIFNIEDAQTGVNYPPMHPWCRSTTVEYDPDEAADWASDGEEMPEDMSFEDWEKWQEENAANPLENAAKSDKIKEEALEIGYKSFSDGEEINSFFYYDDEKRGLLSKKNSRYSKWEKQLSEDSKEAIFSYTADGYGDVNDYLRKKQGWEDINAERVEAQISALDEAIKSFALKSNIIVQRGVPQNALDFLFETYDNIEELTDLIGKKYYDAAYMSTTALYNNSVATTKNVVFDISVPKGIGRGAYINEFGGAFKDAEYEFLIKRGSSFTITDVAEDIENDKIFIKMILDID